ncbi:MAG TPA: hypothetical protein IAA29_20060 [Candidatus Paenibacillus intestinavium]|nr:hypothetical protein [Candidatus Paenibacillus intestinavium]
MIVDYFAEGNEPTSITLSYYDQLNGNELELKVSMMFNATCLFSTANNLQKIIIQYNEEQLTLERKQLQTWLGYTLDQIESEKKFLKQVNKKLEAGERLPI